MSPHSVNSLCAQNTAGKAFTSIFLTYSKQSEKSPKTKPLKRFLDTLFTNSKRAEIVKKIVSESAWDGGITVGSAPAFDHAAPYQKPVHKPLLMVCLDGDGYIRLNDVLTVYPVSRAAWYDGVLKGIYPAGVKLGPRSVGWSRAAIRELIANPPKF